MDVTIHHKDEQEPIRNYAESLEMTKDGQLIMSTAVGQFKYSMDNVEEFEVED